MAIVIEEEKNRTAGLGRIIGWSVFLVIIVAAIYYVFFAAPQLVILTPGDNLSTIAPIVQSPPDVNSLVQSPAFRALNSSTSIPAVATSSGPGRPNPFLQP